MPIAGRTDRSIVSDGFRRIGIEPDRDRIQALRDVYAGELRDELHVTVVATGLGPQVRQEKPVKVVDNTQVAQAAAPAPAAAGRAEQPVNYRDYDRPTVMRSTGPSTAAKQNPQEDLDYLDIPAFLRRQAD